MSFPLNLSKVTPPRLPHLLNRTRLLELLKENQDKEIILVLGPAAQGKSTLAVSWADAVQASVAWVNLGPEDADPVSLLYLVVHALERALPDRDFSSVLVYPSLFLGPREELSIYRDWARSLFGLVSMRFARGFSGHPARQTS